MHVSSSSGDYNRRYTQLKYHFGPRFLAPPRDRGAPGARNFYLELDGEESEVVNVQGGKSSSMRLRAETIQGRSTSLSGDDSDSEESELDASEGTGVY